MKKQINSGIGGQAVMEGIMMRNKTVYSIAVRKPDGEIDVSVHPCSDNLSKSVWMKIPIIRGVISFVSSLVIGMKILMYSASFFEDEEEEKEKAKMTPEELKAYEEKAKKEEKAAMTGGLLLGVVMAVAIFMLLPYGIRTFLSRFIDNRFVLSLLESLTRIVIFIIYLTLISRQKDIQRTFMYHGAEHKCINCVEHGLPLTVKNVLASSRFHKRCGTSFLFLVVIVSAIVLMLVQALINTDSHLTRILIRILLIPVIAGISYELIIVAGKYDNPFMNLLTKPGLAMQRLTTREPDASMAEVAIAAVEEVFDWPAFLKSSFGYRPTVSEAADIVKSKLKKAGFAEAENEARLLTAAAAGIDVKRFLLSKDEILPEEAEKKLEDFLKRRLKHEPVQYITGTAGFYGRDFQVKPGVLIPRFDTEVLVEETLKAIKDGDRVLDVCTGSGCIITTLALERTIEAFGSDISEEALSCAAANAQRLSADVSFMKSDLLDDIDGKFDIIVSNPPYIKTRELARLERQVAAYEPASALDGGPDGCDFYRRLVNDAPAHLNEGGRLLFEIGYDEAGTVSLLMQDAGFTDTAVVQDLSGHNRVVYGTWSTGNV